MKVFGTAERGVIKMLNALQVANYFLNKSVPNTDYSITHLKLQKLVYYAQAWYYTFTGERLFEEQIEAWVHGPVCRELYTEFREWGYRQIIVEGIEPPILNKNQKEILELVWDNYGAFDGKYLEALTHSEAPWIDARGEVGDFDLSNNIITPEKMRAYYEKRLDG
ncbi:DUF4065 domain-containing protein [Bacillus subtilis]|nr:DUF4065 domain-containing protein [Bacillus subtilis]QAT59983.1 DUF4065 domain-containing protein [Bacillus subtilis]QHM06509.1 hypothetical protein C7M27_02447 [Bacillus subtilis]